MHEVFFYCKQNINKLLFGEMFYEFEWDFHWFRRAFFRQYRKSSHLYLVLRHWRRQRMMIIRQSDTKYWLPTSTIKEHSSLKVIFFYVSVPKNQFKFQYTVFLLANIKIWMEIEIWIVKFTLWHEQKKMILNKALL